MASTLPLVEPLARALYLRSLGMFQDLGSSELAALASYFRAQVISRGTVLFDEGAPPKAIHVLVEGGVRIERGGRTILVYDAPAGVGVVGLLAGRATPRAVVDRDVVALTMDAATFLDLVEDHFAILLHVRSVLSRQLHVLQEETGIYHHSLAPPRPSGPYPEAPLGLVERLLWMRRSPVFQGLGLNVLAEVVRDDLEVRAEPGDVLWEKGAAAPCFLGIVHGVVSCGADEGPRAFRAGPGVSLGIDAAYGGVPHGYRAVAETRLVAIRLCASIFLDVMEDQPALALNGLRVIARELLRLAEIRAEQGGEPAIAV